MGGYDDNCTILRELTQMLKHKLRICFIESPGWLISQHNLWLRENEPCQSNSLLFTTRKFAHCSRFGTSKPDCSQRRCHPFAGDTGNSNLNVLQYREIGYQSVVLKQVPDVCSPKFATCTRIHGCDVESLKFDSPRIRCSQPTHHIEQGCFSTAGGPRECRDTTCPKRGCESLQNHPLSKCAGYFAYLNCHCGSTPPLASHCEAALSINATETTNHTAPKPTTAAMVNGDH